MEVPNFGNKFLITKEGKNGPESFVHSIFKADHISYIRELGGGEHGDVYEVEVQKGKHKRRFALKNYFIEGLKDYTEDKAIEKTKLAYLGYILAKKIGLKVFRTLRISTEQVQLIMTLGTDENYTLIGGGSKIKLDKVNEISNIEELIKNIKESVLIATKAKVNVGGDSYFYTFNKSEPTKIDFVVGDYDSVYKSNLQEKSLLRANLKEAVFSVYTLINLYIEEGERSKYKAIVPNLFGLNNI